MKLKKWLATILAVVMAVGTFGVLAGCGDNSDDKDPDNSGITEPGKDPEGPGDSGDDTATQYYLVGSGLGTLAISNWDQTSTDESLKFTRTGNILTITADLYEGDQFQIVHNQAWDGQMGSNIVANEGKDENGNVIFVGAGGYDISNITVAEGQSGKYELTVTLNSEADYASNSLTWKIVEKYDVVFATWIDVDGETEIAKTVVKKDSTTTSRLYETDKLLYEFDQWVTDPESKTAFDFTKVVTDNITLYATIKESANANYVEDDSTWQIKPAGGEAINFTRDPDYKQHNVFIATYEMEDGAEFSITNGTIANAKITGLDSSRLFAYTEEKYTTNQGSGGNYKFTLITEKTGDEVKVSQLRADSIAPTYNGYAVVGAIPGADWKYVDGVNPKMVETGTAGIYTATLVVPESGCEIKVAGIVKNNIDWDAGDWGEGGKKGGNIKITEAGTYTVTLNTNTDTVTVTKRGIEYYIVGTFVDAQGATQNFAVVDGLTPKLEKGDGDIYTVTFVVTDVTSASDYGWVKEQGGDSAIFAFKVAYVEADGTTIDWGKTYGMKDGQVAIGGDANFYITEAGTYTITLDVAAGMVTVEKQ